MPLTDPIPALGLYGEIDAFPDVVHCEDISARAPGHDWTIAPHRHDKMSQLFIITDGRAAVRVDGEQKTLKNGNFLYVPEHCVHEFQFDPGTEGIVLSFPLSVVRTIGPNAPELLEMLAGPFTGDLTTSIEESAKTVGLVALSDSPFRVAQLVGLAHSLLAQLADIKHGQSRVRQTAKPPRILQLDQLIATNMQDAWTVAEYASALSVSSGHLSRLCRSATGMGANAYIQQRVMGEACRLLAFTQLPVSEIGYRLGYIDPSYFSKRFRAERGETPSDYRAKFTSS